VPEQSSLPGSVNLQLMTVDVLHSQRTSELVVKLGSHVVDDGTDEAVGQTSSDFHTVDDTAQVVHHTHVLPDSVVGVVLGGCEDQALLARFGEVEVQGLELVVGLAAFEAGGEAVEHVEVAVVGEAEFDVVDASENAEGEEAREVGESVVDDWVEVLDDEGLAVHDGFGFFGDLLADQEDGGSFLDRVDWVDVAGTDSSVRYSVVDIVVSHSQSKLLGDTLQGRNAFIGVSSIAVDLLTDG
jgi:hypothetical protein